MEKDQYNFDQVPDRRNTDSVKWNLYDEDVLPMWVADMDLRTPQEVVDALKNRVDHGIFGYAGCIPGLKEFTAGWIKEHYDWDIQPEHITPIPGVVTGFNLACRAVADPGDGVVFHTPVYPPFFRVSNNQNLIEQSLEFHHDIETGQYHIDLPALKSTISNKSKVYLLCNPQNPTGKVFSKDELENLASVCLENNVIICSDEIHCDLIYSGHKHIPIGSLDSEIANNTITLIAPSKTFNIPGLDCSFAIIQNPELMEKFEQSRDDLTGHVNLLGQVAGLAAYQHGADWLKSLLTYLEYNRDFLYENIKNRLPKIKMSVPEGTYLAWLDCSHLELNENPYQFFLNKAKIAFNDGVKFGPGGKDYVRLNFGCPTSLLDDAINRMVEAIE